MHEIHLLKESPIVEHFDVLDFKQGTNFYYLKVCVILIDASVLYIRLFVSDDDYNYSFHWQDSNGLIITRWDNSPHHHKLVTFPHHKHVGASFEESNEISLEEVLFSIKSMLHEAND